MRFSLSAVFVSEISEIGFNEVENQPNYHMRKFTGEEIALRILLKFVDKR